MNNQTIKSFYYGNLIPNERQMVTGSEIKHVTDELTKVEKLLQQVMGREAIPLLERFEKAQSTLTSITAESYFIDGFKTGARFVMEILDDSYENLEPII